MVNLAPQPVGEIVFQEATRMADLADPVDEGLIDLHAARRRFEALCDRDGVRDEEEAAALALLLRGIAPIDHYRRWRRFTTYVERGGDVTSAYGRRLAADAGLEARPIARQWPHARREVNQQRPRVIRMRRHEGPNQAA